MPYLAIAHAGYTNNPDERIKAMHEAKAAVDAAVGESETLPGPVVHLPVSTKRTPRDLDDTDYEGYRKAVRGILNQHDQWGIEPAMLLVDYRHAEGRVGMPPNREGRYALQRFTTTATQEAGLRGKDCPVIWHPGDAPPRGYDYNTAIIASQEIPHARPCMNVTPRTMRTILVPNEFEQHRIAYQDTAARVAHLNSYAKAAPVLLLDIVGFMLGMPKAVRAARVRGTLEAVRDIGLVSGTLVLWWDHSFPTQRAAWEQHLETFAEVFGRQKPKE